MNGWKRFFTLFPKLPMSAIVPYGVHAFQIEFSKSKNQNQRKIQNWLKRESVFIFFLQFHTYMRQTRNKLWLLLWRCALQQWLYQHPFDFVAMIQRSFFWLGLAMPSHDWIRAWQFDCNSRWSTTLECNNWMWIVSQQIAYYQMYRSGNRMCTMSSIPLWIIYTPIALYLSRKSNEQIQNGFFFFYLERIVPIFWSMETVTMAKRNSKWESQWKWLLSWLIFSP